MPRLTEELCEWTEQVSRKLPSLSSSQAKVLALYSFGMVLTRCSGLNTVAVFLAMLLGKSENTMRQQLREFTYDQDDKRGKKRREVAVEGCFAGLLSWVISWWADTEKRLALVLDATTFKDIFTVLAVSVVYRGCAIPVAWCVLPAGGKEAWKGHWLHLLDVLATAIPTGWTVLVLADRGLYAKWLYKAIVKKTWHPFLRINVQGQVRPCDAARFRPLAAIVSEKHPTWSGEVVCFKTPKARLETTLLARFDPVYSDPWLVLTDLSPHWADIAWYGMRSWIEAGFKDLKRGGWHWHQTRMTDTDRAARLWLVMAVATLWVLSVGGYAEADLPPSSLPFLPPYFPYRCRPRRASQPRLVSCFARGILIILVALIRNESFPFGEFCPEPWPDSPPSFPKTYP